MDRAPCSKVLAINRCRSAVAQPFGAYRAGNSHSDPRVGLCADEECTDSTGVHRPDYRDGQLRPPRTALEAVRLVPGLRWPGDGTLLAQALEHLSRSRSETLIVTYHDRHGKLICTTQHAGGIGGIKLNYRDLIESALANRAAGMLLVHNHPSGDHTPSAEDITATKSLAALCRPLDLIVHDHLIVGAKAITSMAGAGLLQSASKSEAKGIGRAELSAASPASHAPGGSR